MSRFLTHGYSNYTIPITKKPYKWIKLTQIVFVLLGNRNIYFLFDLTPVASHIYCSNIKNSGSLFSLKLCTNKSFPIDVHDFWYKYCFLNIATEGNTLFFRIIYILYFSNSYRIWPLHSPISLYHLCCKRGDAPSVWAIKEDSPKFKTLPSNIHNPRKKHTVKLNMYIDSIIM